jgi:hypothetical protein
MPKGKGYSNPQPRTVKPRRTPSTYRGGAGSADAQEQSNWNRNRPAGTYASVIDHGRAMGYQQGAMQRFFDGLNAQAGAGAAPGGGSPVGGGGYSYSSGGGGGGRRGYGGRGGGGGGGGGGFAGPPQHIRDAYVQLLTHYNTGMWKSPFQPQLDALNKTQASSRKEISAQDAALVKRLRELGSNPYANPQISSVAQQAPDLSQFLGAQGVDPAALQAQQALAAQLEAQDRAAQQRMASQLGAGWDAEQRSRLAEAAFIRSGSDRMLADQGRAYTAQIEAQIAAARQQALQQLLQFAMENSLKPEGILR